MIIPDLPFDNDEGLTADCRLTLEFPAFVIAVCRTLFPLESSPGQSPIKLTKDFAFEKREKSPISATIEIAET